VCLCDHILKDATFYFIFHTIDLYVKSLKEGRNRGLDPSLRELSTKSSLVCRVSEPILKDGRNCWDLFLPPLKL
jgi:hypothetical protein